MHMELIEIKKLIKCLEYEDIFWCGSYGIDFLSEYGVSNSH